MEIKAPKRPNIILVKLQRFIGYKVLSGILLFFIYSAALILFSGYLYKEGFFGEILKPIIEENIRISVNYLKGLSSNPEHIVIDIKQEDFRKLEYKKETALEEGVLHVFPDDYVPAKIRWHRKTFDSKLRLKGDLADHWSRDFKWSFRVIVKSGDTVMGMKKFSLQHPRTRGFMNDWILHKMLQRFGFITLRYEFVDVVVNGRHLGVCLLEEHFERKLLDNNKRLNSPIIRIRDHLLWYLVDPTKTVFTKDDLDEQYTSSPIDAFNSATINSDPAQLNNFNQAKNLLEGFRRGQLETHQVFDVDKLAKIFAIIDLLGYRHTTAYSNIRFYYDPVISKLVPVGYDNTFIMDATGIEGENKSLGADKSQHLNWYETFFRDKIFFEKYIAALEEVADKRFLDSLIAGTRSEYNSMLAILYRTFPGYSFEDKISILYNNQKFIKRTIDPLEGIQAYFHSFDPDKKTLSLQIGNIQFLPVELLNISCDGVVFPISQDDLFIQPKSKFQPVNFQKISFKVPSSYAWSDSSAGKLKANYRLIGTNRIKSVNVYPWKYMDDNFIETYILKQDSNIGKYDFIRVDEERKAIYFKSGALAISDNIIIPGGYTVYVSDGTQINLTKSAKIISYSPISLIGTQERPISISSSDSTGQGLAVLKTDKMSKLEYVIFKNLSVPSAGLWKLSSPVTFYESAVEISNCQFERNRNGFGLSIIRTKLRIDNTAFRQMTAPLNIAFSDGAITNSSFIESSGDGITVVGSSLKGQRVYLQDIIKTAWNISENSHVSIDELKIVRANIAILGRDLAEIQINNMVCLDCKTGFIAYQASPGFGPSKIDVREIEIKGSKNSGIVEEKSSLVINGNAVDVYYKNVAKLIEKNLNE